MAVRPPQAGDALVVRAMARLCRAPQQLSLSLSLSASARTHLGETDPPRGALRRRRYAIRSGRASDLYKIVTLFFGYAAFPASAGEE